MLCIYVPSFYLFFSVYYFCFVCISVFNSKASRYGVEKQIEFFLYCLFFNFPEQNTRTEKIILMLVGDGRRLLSIYIYIYVQSASISFFSLLITVFWVCCVYLVMRTFFIFPQKKIEFKLI